MAAEAAIGLVRSRLARNLQASANPQALLPGCCLGTTVAVRPRVGPGAVKESGYEARLEQSGVPFWHKKSGKCEIRPDLGSLQAGCGAEPLLESPIAERAESGSSLAGLTGTKPCAQLWIVLAIDDAVGY